MENPKAFIEGQISKIRRKLGKLRKTNFVFGNSSKWNQAGTDQSTLSGNAVNIRFLKMG